MIKKIISDDWKLFNLASKKTIWRETAVIGGSGGFATVSSQFDIVTLYLVEFLCLLVMVSNGFTPPQTKEGGFPAQPGTLREYSFCYK